MKIALAQMEVVAGRPKKNLETMLSMIDKAKQQGVDLIAFPEMCVGGYLVGDRWTEDSFCKNLMEFDEVIRRASEGIAIAYGNVYVDENDAINQRTGDEGGWHPNKDGRSRKYNAVRVFQNGKPARRKQETPILPKGVQPKGLLPNYRFFDDERYFFSLEDVAKDAGEFHVPLARLAQPFLIEADGKEIPIGFEVCEDLWCEDYRRNGRAQNITKMLINNWAEYIVNISASPWTFGKNAARDRRIEFLKQDCEQDMINDEPLLDFKPFLYVNHTGAQNNGKNIVTFDGGSTVYNSDGKPVVLSKEMYGEELMVVDTDTIDDLPVLTRKDKSVVEEKYEAIVAGIRHVKDILGTKEQPKYVIGLSGGVDSAVVAALLVQAVGKDKVLAVNMPTEYNSEKTKDAAAYIADKLGITYMAVPVGNLAKHNMALLAEQHLGRGDNGTVSEFGEENLTAKLRGTAILSNIAAENGALFTNNGNKLETALGYATLYGDVGGAIAPIADLTKVEVFDLARFLNEEVYGMEVIPETLLPDDLYKFRDDQIKPSAELKKEQVDPMKFGYHDALLTMYTDFKKSSPEDIMGWYASGELHEHIGKALGKDAEYGLALMQRWEVTDAQEFVQDLEWFSKGIARSVFKRVQSPPIIITSKTAYGYDLRESMLPWDQTIEYDCLREQVLAIKEYQPKIHVQGGKK